LLPINEFARPYQSKNNGIYAACENGELSALLGLKGSIARQERVGLTMIPPGGEAQAQRVAPDGAVGVALIVHRVRLEDNVADAVEALALLSVAGNAEWYADRLGGADNLNVGPRF
jgi:hypothetical protein